MKADAPTYLATAYRWGETNNHNYHVYAGLDRTKAIALAKGEAADRGGKYAGVVWEFDGDGTDYRVIAYFHSSACREETVKPHHNHRHDFFQHLGFMVNEAANGSCLLPDPGDPKRLTYQPVSIPDFMMSEVKRQREFLKIWETTEEKHEASEAKKGGTS